MRDYNGMWYTADDPRADTMRIQFYTKAVEDVAATAEARRDNPNAHIVWIDAPHARLRSPEDPKTEWDGVVKDEYKFRFAKAWAAFERGAINEIVGTPLGKWGHISQSTVLTYQQMGINTVEEVAVVPDDQLAYLGKDGVRIRKAALEFLKPQDRATTDLQKQNVALQTEVESLKANLSQLMEQIKNVELEQNEQRRGPGRPRNAA